MTSSNCARVSASAQPRAAPAQPRGAAPASWSNARTPPRRCAPTITRHSNTTNVTRTPVRQTAREKPKNQQQHTHTHTHTRAARAQRRHLQERHHERAGYRRCVKAARAARAAGRDEPHLRRHCRPRRVHRRASCALTDARSPPDSARVVLGQVAVARVVGACFVRCDADVRERQWHVQCDARTSQVSCGERVAFCA